MTHRIQEDHHNFRQIIGGKQREELKKYITTGGLFRLRANGKGIQVPLPRIITPYITWGKSDQGVGRGPGKPGDIIRPGKKPGQGNKPGTDPGDGMLVDVPLEEVLKLLKEELELPDLKPKANQTYEEIRHVYNGLSKIGPRSLLHKKKTMAAAMKRLAAMGRLSDRTLLPGLTEPVPVLVPINDDRRFRQWNEVKIPNSNAVIFFLRDGSGSMDQYKCDIVSDIAYWLNLYITAYYQKTERCFIWHDTQARELSEKDFFGLRYGGGTFCTSSLKLMAKIIKNRYSPVKWNIYAFYFGDGESDNEDNRSFARMLRNDLGVNVVNMFGQVEILNWGYAGGLKNYIDKAMEDPAQGHRLRHVRNVDIKRPKSTSGDMWSFEQLTDEQRDGEIKRVLKALLSPSKEVRSQNKSSDIQIEEVV